MTADSSNKLGFLTVALASAILLAESQGVAPAGKLWSHLATIFLIFAGTSLMLGDGAISKTVSTFVFFVAITVVLALATWLVAIGWAWARTHLTVTVVLLIVSVGGGGLFFFRLHWRCMYGVSEAFAGFALSLHRAMNTDDVKPEFVAFILTAGVYLVVRGLDNIHQGWIAKEPDPVARWIVGKVRPSLLTSPKPEQLP